MKKMKIKMTVREKKANLSYILMSVPITLYTVLLIIIPFVVMFVMSFMTKGALGRIKYTFTIQNYKMMLDFMYLKIIGQSLLIAALATIATVCIAYPLAYYTAKKNPQISGILRLAMMLPLWANSLVIVYSFVTLLNSSGIVNTFLIKIGLIKQPLELLYNNFSVILGMTYLFLPFAMLPMYSSIEKVENNLMEASSDLGAKPFYTFMHITLPMTMPGILAGILLVFIPTIGYYMIADMLGGGTSILIGNTIYNQFTTSRNWPFGAALSMILAVIILIMMTIYSKLGGDLDELGV